MTKVIVYIEESNSISDVTFPSLPHVVSLLHYDDASRTSDNLHPPAGYPVICVTVSLALFIKITYVSLKKDSAVHSVKIE